MLPTGNMQWLMCLVVPLWHSFSRFGSFLFFCCSIVVCLLYFFGPFTFIQQAVVAASLPSVFWLKLYSLTLSFSFPLMADTRSRLVIFILNIVRRHVSIYNTWRNVTTGIIFTSYKVHNSRCFFAVQLTSEPLSGQSLLAAACSSGK